MILLCFFVCRINYITKLRFDNSTNFSEIMATTRIGERNLARPAMRRNPMECKNTNRGRLLIDDNFLNDMSKNIELSRNLNYDFKLNTFISMLFHQIYQLIH